jgi:hypothetical protein
MTLKLNPEKALIFRICHIKNLPWILDNGLHARNGAAFDPKFFNIGNPDLIDKRATRKVEVGPRGTLSDYVPFYFTPYSIMLFNIKTGYGGIKQVANDDIVIFVSSLLKFDEAGVRFVFTNQHAYPRMAEYFTEIEDLHRIDWELLQSRNFKHDPDDPGKKERYQAEALAWKNVPLSALSGIAAHSEKVQSEIDAMLAARSVDLKTVVRPTWYF